MAPTSWTLAEAAAWLDPPVTEAQLRAFVRALAIAPVPEARRPRSRSSTGRPPKRYSCVEIMHLHAAITPWLTPT